MMNNRSNSHDGASPIVDQSNYRWFIVAAGGLIGCMAAGSMFSLPVFLLAMTQDTGWSRTGISTAMTIAFLAMALGSIAWGARSDHVAE